MGLRQLHYTYQKNEGGIAHALALLSHLSGKEKVVVILGVTLHRGSIKRQLLILANSLLVQRYFEGECQIPGVWCCCCEAK